MDDLPEATGTLGPVGPGPGEASGPCAVTPEGRSEAPMTVRDTAVLGEDWWAGCKGV